MQRFLFLWVNVPCSGGSKVCVLVYLPGHTRDTKLVSCSTNGAVDMELALKVSGTGSIMLALKASKHTCLESEWHGIDSCVG
jgi:hypothetical protein